MTIDSAIKKLERVLKSFNCPVARLSFEDKAEAYITYQMLQAVPAEYADDDYTFLTYAFGVVVNAQKDRIIKLLSDVIQRLREEGFIISSIEAESFNTADGLILTLFNIHKLIHPEVALMFCRTEPDYEDDIDAALGGF